MPDFDDLKKLADEHDDKIDAALQLSAKRAV